MKHEHIHGHDDEPFTFDRWESSVGHRMQDRYIFTLPEGEVTLSVIAGGGTYGAEPGQTREIALLRDGAFLKPSQVGLRGFNSLFEGDQVAGFVPIDTIFIIIERLHQKERLYRKVRHRRVLRAR